ncbi:MAG: SurA N-terminal domain-containing protein [bacterium]
MLRFFREKAAVFVWVIVIAFVLTLFAGAYLSKFSGGESSSVDVRSEAVARFGDYSVSEQQYRQFLSQQLGGYVVDGKLKVSPDVIELLQYQVLIKLLQDEVFYQAAVSKKIKVTKRDWAQAFQELIMYYDLKDKKALKSFLKEQGRSFSSFKKELKRTILARKFTMFLQAPVSLDKQDIEQSFRSLKLRYLYVNPKKGADVSKQIQDLSDRLKSGMLFSEVDSFFSDEEAFVKVSSESNWIGYGELPFSVQKVAYVLDKNEVSQPISYGDAYFIVQSLDSKRIPAPKDYEESSYKDQLTSALKSRALSQYVSFFLLENPLQIQDMTLQAIDAKKRRDFDSAIAAYRLLSSQQVSNPMPHYFLGKLYLGIQDYDNAKDELLKAEVKVGLLKGFQFPELFFVLGQYFEIMKDSRSSLDYYRKALSFSEYRLDLLEPLKEKFSQLKRQPEVQQIQKYIRQLEEKKDKKVTVQSGSLEKDTKKHKLK